ERQKADATDGKAASPLARDAAPFIHTNSITDSKGWWRPYIPNQRARREPAAEFDIVGINTIVLLDWFERSYACVLSKGAFATRAGAHDASPNRNSSGGFSSLH